MRRCNSGYVKAREVYARFGVVAEGVGAQVLPGTFRLFDAHTCPAASAAAYAAAL